MKKYLALSVLGVLFVPVIASAAWWNPFTWGHKNIPPVSIQEPKSIEVTEPVQENKSTVAPTVITKTVTVVDPAQKEKIDSLLGQVNDLKNKLDSLTQENENLKKENQSLKDQIKDKSQVDLQLTRQNLVIRYEIEHPKADCGSSAGLLAAGYGSHTRGQPSPTAAADCMAAQGQYKVYEDAWVNDQLKSIIK